MFKQKNKYGNITLDGVSIEIDTKNSTELEKYIEKLESKRNELIAQQNEYLSQIIN